MWPELLRRFREETQEAHLEAEATVRILDEDAGVDTYRRYLEKMYGFHAPLEEALAANVELEARGFHAASRARAELILRDLRALPGGPPALPLARCPKLPDTSSLPRALGCAYVLEGSTLGGQYILRNLGGKLPALRGKATAYLEGYGPRTGAQWKAFGAILVEALASEDAAAAAIDAARETFRCLTPWLTSP